MVHLFEYKIFINISHLLINGSNVQASLIALDPENPLNDEQRTRVLGLYHASGICIGYYYVRKLNLNLKNNEIIVNDIKIVIVPNSGKVVEQTVFTKKIHPYFVQSKVLNYSTQEEVPIVIKVNPKRALMISEKLGGKRV